MQIFFKTTTGKKIILDVEPYETIMDIKEKIKDEEDVYLEKQNLFFARKQLEDDRTLEDYNIKSDSIIHLVTKTGGIIFKIKFEDKIFKTEKWCPCCKKGKDLKEFMNKKTKISINNFELICDEKTLEDNISLEQQIVNVNDNYIDMVLKNINLIIKSNDDVKFEIICENNSTIYKVKEIIKDKYKNLDNFFLIYKFKILIDSKMLKDYGIKNKSELIIATE